MTAPPESRRPGRTLYVSDLDFTLLGNDATLSARTVDVVNRVIGAGHLFTCATARSYSSARRVTSALHLGLPLITYGGAVVVRPDGDPAGDVTPLPSAAVEAVMATTAAHETVEPLLYAMVGGRDRVCWRESRTNHCIETFAARRQDDPRLLPLADWAPLEDAPVFYVTLMGSRVAVAELRQDVDPWLAGCFVTVGPDGYHPEQTWFEITSGHATKAAAANRLRAELGARRLVAFGDNHNDVPLFEIADHACAVANAVPELVDVADELIGSNARDGVADWLEQHVLA